MSREHCEDSGSGRGTKLSLIQEESAYLYLGVPLEPLAGGHGRHEDDGKAAC